MTACWDGEPSSRPTAIELDIRLKMMGSTMRDGGSLRDQNADSVNHGPCDAATPIQVLDTITEETVDCDDDDGNPGQALDIRTEEAIHDEVDSTGEDIEKALEQV
jgi:hypothetical protein